MSVRSIGTRLRRASSTGANAVMTSDRGETTLRTPESSRQVVLMDNESFPTGIERPSAGHSSIATASTASNRSASSPGSPQAAIQFADSTTRSTLETSAETMFVSASATAIRAAARASSNASGVRSPMATASPVKPWNPLNVTAQSATGTCHGPTIWSRATSPPTVRSPMFTRNDLSATAGTHSTRSSAWPTSIRPVSNVPRTEGSRAASRCIRGRSPSRVDIGMETGEESNRASCTSRCRCRVASPTSAHGQRSRSHNAANSAMRPESTART